MLRRLCAIAAFAIMLTACTTTVKTAQPTLARTGTDLMATTTTLSALPFDETTERLEAAISSRGLTLFTVVDHSAGAKSAGLDLPPSKLFIFGNPQGGTPLMQANPALGLDLPLKALVHEQDGAVFVVTTDIRAVTTRAGVTQPQTLIDRIAGALDAIAKDATETG